MVVGDFLSKFSAKSFDAIFKYEYLSTLKFKQFWRANISVFETTFKVYAKSIT